ncbi:hypothetical protein BOX15_Mlig028465g1 [Macrostomum lignano]|uniref:diacylglycerol O-acyltransferase n=2 Tax=Macrostomum lignano TaxID=282301 RepID=A0A267DRR8_9PLAT|nr:hypothetical protein BOX15_Mlig028465g1 [Macrostomum lignano]
MSNGFGLSTAAAADLKAPLPLNADAEVGFEEAQQSASPNVDIGAGDMSAQLEVKLGSGDRADERVEPASNGSLRESGDEAKVQDAGEKPQGQTPKATEQPKGQTTGANEKPEGQTPEANEKPEGQTPEANEKPEDQTPEANEKPEGQTTEANEKPEGQTSEANDRPEGQTPEANEKPEGHIPEATEQPEGQTTEANEKPEGQTPEANEKPEGQTPEANEKPEGQTPEANEKPESQTPEANEKPEGQTPEANEKPEGQTPEANEKPEGQTPEANEKPEGQTPEPSEKPEPQSKPEPQTPEPSERPEPESKPETQTPKASQETHTQAEPSASKRAENRSRNPDQRKSSEGEPAESQRGFRIFGIEFAPLNTPMRRRLQTLAVLQWLLSITVMPIICVLFIMMTLLTPLAPLSLAYVAWIFFFDRNTSQRGGRRLERVRRWSLWRHYRDYFPIRLVKSADLDPAHNYLIGYHPHGIISCGAFCNFGTEATGFSAKFPGIKPYLLTLRINFFWPLLRGYFMSVGVCDVSRSSLRWILGREGGGNAAIVVVGGAQEALDARPGNYKLTLLKRKGFARMALQTGAHLVPCFSFGENDLFRQAANPPGSWVRAFQQIFKGALGSSPPFFYGRGVFNYTFGLLPYRHAVTTVVGAPIPVEKCPEPSAEQVDRLHRLYMERLADLFDEFKAEHGVKEDVRLEFV